MGSAVTSLGFVSHPHRVLHGPQESGASPLSTSPWLSTTAMITNSPSPVSRKASKVAADVSVGNKPMPARVVGRQGSSTVRARSATVLSRPRDSSFQAMSGHGHGWPRSRQRWAHRCHEWLALGHPRPAMRGSVTAGPIVVMRGRIVAPALRPPPGCLSPAVVPSVNTVRYTALRRWAMPQSAISSLADRAWAEPTHAQLAHSAVTGAAARPPSDPRC